MKNKHGFTLIEIIICISLIILIFGASIFGIKIINKNITNKELSKVANKIYNAANVYIESKTESKKQLYNKNNAVIIPLNVLQNEGYITLDNINIDDHYVLSVLGSEKKEAACIETTTIGTWEITNDKEIYLCTNIDVSIPINELLTKINAIENKFNGYVKINDYNLKISEIEQRLTDLEKKSSSNIITKLTSDDGEYFARGKNPNNYVRIKNGATNTTWRIVEISNNDVYIIATNKNLLLNSTDIDSLNPKPFYYNLIEKGNYVRETFGNSGTRGLDVGQITFTESLVGKLSYTSLLNATTVTGNYIIDLFKTILKDTENEISLNFEYSSSKDGCVEPSGYINSGYLRDTCDNIKVLPLVKLKTCVKLIDNTSCTSDGSSSCPYLIDNSSC